MTVLESLGPCETEAAVYAAPPAVEGLENKNPASASPTQDRPSLMSVVQRFSTALLDDGNLPAVGKALVEAIEQIFPTAAIIVTAGETIERNSTEGHVTPTKCDGGAARAADERATLTRLFQTPLAAADTSAPAARRINERVRGDKLPHCLRVPLADGGETISELSLYFPERPVLADDEADFLAILAAQAALAIRQRRIRAQAAQQSVELRKLNAELAKSHLAKTEFLSVVSHEFRTPLNIIMGYAALMEEELVGSIGAEQRNCVEQIRNASHDLLDLVTRMLQAGSLEAGLVAVNNQEIALDGVFQELKKRLRPFDRDKVQLVWELPAGLPLVTSDPEKLQQVLHNLLDNALKFTERGYVRVSGKSVPERRQLEIKISDTGIGIAAEALPMVFDRYRQVDGSINRAYEGLGLGLFIAKKLTELVGGTLTATSEIGKGSTFNVALPLNR